MSQRTLAALCGTCSLIIGCAGGTITTSNPTTGTSDINSGSISGTVQTAPSPNTSTVKAVNGIAATIAFSGQIKIGRSTREKLGEFTVTILSTPEDPDGVQMDDITIWTSEELMKKRLWIEQNGGTIDSESWGLKPGDYGLGEYPELKDLHLQPGRHNIKKGESRTYIIHADTTGVTPGTTTIMKVTKVQMLVAKNGVPNGNYTGFAEGWPIGKNALSATAVVE